MTPAGRAFAVTTPGLEGITAHELRVLQLEPGRIEPGGVEFAATADQLADALLWLRTANRVTLRLGSFRARTFAELERHGAAIPWEQACDPARAVHLRVSSAKSRLYHLRGIADRLERIIGLALPGVPTIRSPGDAAVHEAEVTAIPELQRIIVRISRDVVTISADATGALLHRRGYRQAVAKAPLRETLAAALVLASDWTPDQPLIDPMCGSGTIPIEAALIARGMAPGLRRRFAAEAWPGWAPVFDRARQRAATVPGRGVGAPPFPLPYPPLVGSDRDAGAIEAARSNAERAGVPDVRFDVAPISAMRCSEARGAVIVNPPYGARVGDPGRLRDLYATIGQAMRRQCSGWHLTMLSADATLDAQVGLPLRQVFRTTNGGIPVRALATE